MDYADIYYVDTRNADSRDHRSGPVIPGAVIPGRVMSPIPMQGGGTGVRTVYVQPQAPLTYGGSVPMMGGVPMIPGQYPAIPGYPPFYGQPSAAATLLGKAIGRPTAFLRRLDWLLKPLRIGGVRLYHLERALIFVGIYEGPAAALAAWEAYERLVKDRQRQRGSLVARPRLSAPAS